MKHAVRVAAPVLLWAALTGCTAAGPHAPAEHRPRALVVAEARSDVGNDRPQVSFDGLMVRRRIVLAVRSNDPAADLATTRRALHRAALLGGTTVSPISASVLDPIPLEQLAPDLVVVLPPDASLADGQGVMDLALEGGGWGDEAPAYAVQSVLVHDLTFTVRASHPAVLARDIAREGILADALGHYTAVQGAQRLDILYTGPLLSDRLLRSVEAAIARRAGVAPASVTVGPRVTTGTGVALAEEPEPPPADDSSSSGHDHGP